MRPGGSGGFCELQGQGGSGCQADARALAACVHPEVERPPCGRPRPRPASPLPAPCSPRWRRLAAGVAALLVLEARRGAFPGQAQGYGHRLPKARSASQPDLKREPEQSP